MIFVNFKTYPEGTGEKAVGLAKICQQVAKSSGVPIIPVVQAVDVNQISEIFTGQIWVQHLDPYLPDRATGFINLEALVEAGATGTILNHSEHKIPFGTIKQSIKRIEKINNNSDSTKQKIFQTLVCCRSLSQAERFAKLKPSFIAYEPPELIGGDVSVSESRPEMIKHFVEICSAVPAIIGAGIKNETDVKIGLQLGVKGILVSSGVVLAKDPEKILLEFSKSFHASL
jgi:triosephosphate isomerase (TIM)